METESDKLRDTERELLSGARRGDPDDLAITVAVIMGELGRSPLLGVVFARGDCSIVGEAWDVEVASFVVYVLPPRERSTTRVLGKPPLEVARFDLATPAVLPEGYERMMKRVVAARLGASPFLSGVPVEVCGFDLDLVDGQLVDDFGRVHEHAQGRCTRREAT
jgi:hypothetical protein